MDIPMPGTSHPDMGGGCMPKDFRKSGFTKLDWMGDDHPNEFVGTYEYTDFYRQTYFGAAPFVGDPEEEQAFYVWDAWVAADGRWIGGHEAHLQWRYVY